MQRYKGQCCMQADIVDTLLQSIKMQAALSLEPLLMLLGILARDLQADYLPYIPRILTAFSNLVDAGNTNLLHFSLPNLNPA